MERSLPIIVLCPQEIWEKPLWCCLKMCEAAHEISRNTGRKEEEGEMKRDHLNDQRCEFTMATEHRGVEHAMPILIRHGEYGFTK